MTFELKLIAFVDRLAMFLTRHWLSVVVYSIGVIAGLPILAPVLVHFGFNAPAQIIYWVYSFTCHQLAYRSFFLFGNANAYNVTQLQTALGTTAPASDALYWRQFQGNADLGYKMAWCERDAAMYLSMMVAFVLFGLLRDRVRPLNWRIYLLFLVPMAIDGFWQLLTSPLDLVPFLPTHESTPELRIFTGVLFGFATAWLIYPHLNLAMRDTFAHAQAQHEHIQAKKI